MPDPKPWVEIKESQSRFGRSVIILDTCDSTNDVAMELARSNYPDGTVVIAKHQLRGKGRAGRVWESFAGNIALSVLIRPALSIKCAHRLVFASAYATVCALRHFGIEAEIKWPNDILIKPRGTKKLEKLGHYRKVGGILLELCCTDQKIDAAVIGIGLNLARSKQAVLESALPQIGFIEDVGVPPSISELVNTLLSALEQNLENPSDSSTYCEILQNVKRDSAFLGKEVSVACGERIVSGVAEDLALDGALIVKDAHDNREKIYFGDVHLV